MRHLLVDLLHIFVIFMIAVFVIGGILAAMGTFDHWGERYNLKRRRTRLRRQRKRPADKNDAKLSYASSNPDKTTVTYKGKYA